MRLSVLFIFILGLTHCGNKPSSIDLQGHRGARGLAPENTIPSFKLAVDHGATTLELDLVVSKDRQLVISHEPWFNPVFTTKPDGAALDTSEQKKYNLYRMNYEEIAQFDVGKRVHPDFPEQKAMAVSKPLFKDMVRDIDAYVKEKGKKPIRYNIEVKSSAKWYDRMVPNPAAYAQLVLEAINELGIKDRCNVQSFDFEILKQVHAQDSTIRLDVLIGGGEPIESVIEKLGFKPYSWNPYFTNVTDSIVEHAHAINMSVIPWTVNEPKDMKMLVEMGVDGIITDYPNRFWEINALK